MDLIKLKQLQLNKVVVVTRNFSSRDSCDSRPICLLSRLDEKKNEFLGLSRPAFCPSLSPIVAQDMIQSQPTITMTYKEMYERQLLLILQDIGIKILRSTCSMYHVAQSIVTYPGCVCAAQHLVLSETLRGFLE